MTAGDWLTPLLRDDVLHRGTPGGYIDALHAPDATVEAGGDTAGAFEGLYGRAYSAMIRRRRLRRAFFGMWGQATVLYDLDDIVRRAAADAQHRVGGPLLDVPCGQGVVADLAADQGEQVCIVGLDLAERAVAQGAAAATLLPDGVEARYVLGTALDLPFRDCSMGGIISINGLHVMPDHEPFVRELARVLQPGASCWLITPVSGAGMRSRFMLRAGRALSVLSQPPPTQQELELMVARCGLSIEVVLGTGAIVGLQLKR